MTFLNELEILEKIEIIDEMLSILRQCKPWESDTVLMLSIIAAIQMMTVKGTNT